MKICDNIIISDSVTVTDGSVYIDVPERTFSNCEKVSLVVAQNIPDTATVNAPVYITIGGVTTTLYPLIACNGSTVTASMVKPRNKYSLVVIITGENGLFKLTCPICGQNSNNLSVIPATA